MQRFKDVLQQCACQRDRRSIAVLQTGRESVIHKNILRPVISWIEDANENKIQKHCIRTDNFMKHLPQTHVRIIYIKY